MPKSAPSADSSRERAAETAALKALANALGAPDASDAAERLLKGLQGILGISGGIVVLRGDDGGGVLASRGVPADWAASWEVSDPDELGTRLRAGRVAESLDEGPERVDEALKQAGIQTVWAVPLGEDPAGALVLVANEEGAFVDGRRDALVAVASAFGSWLQLRGEAEASSVPEEDARSREAEGEERLDTPSKTDGGVGAALSRQPDLAVIRTDAEGRIFDWPETAVGMLGWTADEATGRCLDFVLSDDDRAAFVRRLREPEIDPAGEWRVPLTTKSSESLACGLRLLFAEDSNEVVALVRSRRGDEASERWLRWSRALISVLDASTLVLDPGGRIRELGGGWTPRGSKGVARWLGRHVRELFDSDRREVLSALRVAARTGEWTGDLLSGGVPVPLRLSAVRDADGNLEALVGAKLPENASGVGTLFRNIPVGMMLVDAELRVERVNPALRAIGGEGAIPENVEGMDVRSLSMLQSRPAQEALERLQDVHSCDAADVRLKGRAETIVTLRGKSMSDDSGRVTGYLLMFFSATGKTSMEKHLIRSQKMESIGAFASGLSHDFGNYVSVILGKAGVLRVKLPDDPHITSDLADIEAAAKQAQHLSQELMKFARGGRNRVSALDLNKLIDEVGMLIQTSIGKKIDLSLRLQDELEPIEGDEVELQQLVLNLCLNARDAMPKGGQLTVETRPLNRDEVARLPSAEAVGGVCVVVRDTGIGMSPEVAERIFEPFFTTKEDAKGTGLGLAMVYGIVRRHGGVIDVRSELGQGTAFEILFPAAAPHAKKVEQPSQRILVVDDDPAFREMSRLILEEDAFEVLLAADGAEALKTLRNEYDNLGLVILDLKMPGVDGLSVLEELRTLAPDLPVLVTTGYASSEEKDQALRRGAQQVLEKPYRVKEFRRALHECMRRPDDEEADGADGGSEAPDARPRRQESRDESADADLVPDAEDLAAELSRVAREEVEAELLPAGKNAGKPDEDDSEGESPPS